MSGISRVCALDDATLPALYSGFLQQTLRYLKKTKKDRRLPVLLKVWELSIRQLPRQHDFKLSLIAVPRGEDQPDDPHPVGFGDQHDALDEIVQQVHDVVMEVAGIESVTVDLVFEPVWTPERMSDVAKLELGYDI